jgi:hypothetical protein
MRKPKLCAHCDERLGAIKCRACLEPVCHDCYAASTPTDCQHWSDPAPGSPGKRHDPMLHR